MKGRGDERDGRRGGRKEEKRNKMGKKEKTTKRREEEEGKKEMKRRRRRRRNSGEAEEGKNRRVLVPGCLNALGSRQQHRHRCAAEHRSQSSTIQQPPRLPRPPHRIVLPFCPLSRPDPYRLLISIVERLRLCRLSVLFSPRVSPLRLRRRSLRLIL